MFAPFEPDHAVLALKYDLAIRMSEAELMETQEENNIIKQRIGMVIISVAENTSDATTYKAKVYTELSLRAQQDEPGPFKEFIAIIDMYILNTANLEMAEMRYQECVDDLGLKANGQIRLG